MILDRIRRVLLAEAEAIKSLHVDDSTLRAVELISRCEGKVFTTGIGKAGYVAKKAASTFSTTGTPSVFLHPGDASHGDVGVIAPKDILLTFSNSGRTREVLETVHFCRRLGIVSVISMTSSSESPFGEMSDVVLALGTIEEACPFGLTPTSSTSVMIALSDALAVAAMEERGFTREDFSIRHHGGYLGEQLRGLGVNKT